MIEIMQGDAHDVASIMPVMQDAFDPAFGEAWTASQCLAALTMPNTKLILARQETSVIAFAMTRWVLEEEELLMIAVSPQHQRRGVADQLLDHLIKRESPSTIKLLFLEVRDGNPAYFLYKNRGFTESGRRKSYYLGHDGKHRDAITMTLHI
jgi:[ribosomal protein S18]-alanine N-acetyltransferase